MASINVRVLRTKLIDALVAKKKELEISVEKNSKAQKDFEKAKSAWEANVPKNIPANALVEEVSVHESGWRVPNGQVKVEITYLVPKGKFGAAPKFKGDENFDHNSASKIIEIANAISLLNMSDEEYVPTSTYKGVAQYL